MSKARHYKNDFSAERLLPGHKTCAGCAAPPIVRAVLEASPDPVVVCSATGCLEVTTTVYPNTSWNVPFIHSAFENAAATIAGVETAYEVLRDKVDKKLEKNILGYTLHPRINFIAFGGDGGTYDIGLQSLSGALERGHNFLYVCYDNEGYMNTGGQRSGATPRGAVTSTTPAGKYSDGKIQYRKNLMEICAAHNISYCAQASISDLNDLKSKVKKALAKPGAKFINVLSPCPTVWKFMPGDVIKVARLAVETRFWPVYEIENGVYNISYKPKEHVPVEEFLKTQKRFAHLFQDDYGKKTIIAIQKRIDLEWNALLKRA